MALAVRGVTAAIEVPASTLIRAAEYVRMSTDHQKYSTANQSDTIRTYAAARGMTIVRSYVDEGVSGVTFRKRDAVQQLIEHVRSGDADFAAILVYDISRWGRTQDVDEAAYYEYLCKRAGISVHYCAEPFENDGSALATLFKNMKRVMAGEYSRELSVKVFAGQIRLFKLGFRPGGVAAYGMRRLLVNDAGVPKVILKSGQYKSLQTDRVITILGPPEELDTVRWIFSTFVIDRKPEIEIAEILNQKGIEHAPGRPWTYRRVHNLLENEIYIGNGVWNRTSIKLGRRRTHNRPEAWCRVRCNFEPVVNPTLFDHAQAIIQKRSRRLSDEEILEPVRLLLRKRGYLSAKLIDASAGVVSASTLTSRFGSLPKVYARLHYNYSEMSRTDEDLLAMLKALLKRHGRLSHRIIDKERGTPHSSTYLRRFGTLARVYELVGYQPGRNTFQAMQQATRTLSNHDLLELLRGLLAKEGRLNPKIIDKSPAVPCAATYERRFGGLPRAYELIGYMRSRATEKSDAEILDLLRALLAKQGRLTAKIIRGSGEVSSLGAYLRRFGSLARIYDLIGYTQKRMPLQSDVEILERMRALLAKEGHLSTKIIDANKETPSSPVYSRRFGSLLHAYELVGYTQKRRNKTLARQPKNQNTCNSFNSSDQNQAKVLKPALSPTARYKKLSR